MTAMCDVAFLLLSFFILTTKFKPAEALAVTTPKSVSTNPAEQKKVVMVTMDRKGSIYLSLSDDAEEQKQSVIDQIDKQKGLGLSAAEKKSFMRSGFYVGVPFNQLKSYLGKTPDETAKLQLAGIPVTDTLNNELQTWMAAANIAFQGSKMNLLVKGDNEAKYPSFKGVMDAFKKNEIFKFQMITDPEGVPAGTDLYKKTEGTK